MKFTIKKIRPLLVTVLILNIGAIFGWYFLYSLIQSEKNTVIENIQTIKEIKRNQNSQNSLEDLVANTTLEREEINSFFVKNETETVEFLKTLENIDTLLNVEVKILRVEESEITRDSKISDSLNMQILVKGPFSELYHFSTVLENLPYQITVNGVSISSGGTVLTGTVQWSGTYSFVLEGFVKK